MYKTGDYIVKNGNGVCKVENVIHLNLTGIDKDRLYYTLIPVNDKNGKVYVPVDTSMQHLRKAMTMEEAYDLIKEIPSIEELDITNDKLREQKYKEIIKDIEPKSLLRIIKTTYLRRQHRIESGKKSTAVDDRYFTMAENLLFSELCLALKKDKEEIHNLIAETVNG